MCLSFPRRLLVAILISGSAVAWSQTAERSVLVLGDSLAAGHGLEREEAFPAVLQTMAEKEAFPLKVINAGVSGDTSAGGLRRVDWLLKQKVDFLILALGGNDGLRGLPVETTRTNLQSIIDKAKMKYPDIRVIVAGMRMPPNLGADYAARFEKLFAELAEKNNALLVPFLLEGVGGNVKLNQADRIHPTSEGQRILAGNVWKVLRPAL